MGCLRGFAQAEPRLRKRIDVAKKKQAADGVPKDLQFHALADMLPLLEGAEFTALAEDIREHGLREEIVLHEGMILDGRNRYRACLAAEAEPRYRTFGDRPSDGTDPRAFVISAYGDRLSGLQLFGRQHQGGKRFDDPVADALVRTDRRKQARLADPQLVEDRKYDDYRNRHAKAEEARWADFARRLAARRQRDFRRPWQPRGAMRGAPMSLVYPPMVRADERPTRLKLPAGTDECAFGGDLYPVDLFGGNSPPCSSLTTGASSRSTEGRHDLLEILEER